MIKSRETLYRSRARLRAHTEFPAPPIDTKSINTHARQSNLSGETNGFAFFGKRKDPRSDEIEAKGRLTWDTSSRVIKSWFWNPSGKFNGLYLAGDAAQAAIDKNFACDEYNGFYVESTDRSTLLGVGNLALRAIGELVLEEVELNIPEIDLDRLVIDHFDLIVEKMLDKVFQYPKL